jgi:predicted nucleic acid-binding protein
VVVAGLLAAHVDHEAARRVLAAERPRLVAHVGFETYSVLTRLPVPDRLSPGDAIELLERAFPQDPLVLRGRQLRRLLQRLAVVGIAGGAVYDGLVAGTAQQHGAVLVTCDRHATPTYAALGAEIRLLDGE